LGAGCGSFWWQLKRQRLRRPLVVNSEAIGPVSDTSLVIQHYRRWKGKVLKQLSRINGVGKGVMQFAPLVEPKPVLMPMVGRAVALGQQKINDRAQVVGAGVMAGAFLSLGS